ncbi:hypothetical protein PAL_GLEAN10022173 [Pteropus alecto]|uniref:Uncharacterized protein n=1 Tax=Pteropus alecto TaxID=9402 RepID=L5K7V7_PTEAL|nr:hypothetical protein PAL_GLEAN10022173 [Pteropus alecto]
MVRNHRPRPRLRRTEAWAGSQPSLAFRTPRPPPQRRGTSGHPAPPAVAPALRMRSESRVLRHPRGRLSPLPENSRYAMGLRGSRLTPLRRLCTARIRQSRAT